MNFMDMRKKQEDKVWKTGEVKVGEDKKSVKPKAESAKKASAVDWTGKEIPAVKARAADSIKPSEVKKPAEVSRKTESKPQIIAPEIGDAGAIRTAGAATYGLKFESSKNSDAFINTNSPFSGYRITSKTGARNTGIAGASKNHAGIDRAVPFGTAVSVPKNVTFYKSGYDKARGHWAEFRDENGYILHYQHLSKVGGFKTGQQLKAGTVLCYSGNSGVGRAHLHEEYYAPNGANVTESYWAKYANSDGAKSDWAQYANSNGTMPEFRTRGIEPGISYYGMQNTDRKIPGYRTRGMGANVDAAAIQARIAEQNEKRLEKQKEDKLAKSRYSDWAAQGLAVAERRRAEENPDFGYNIKSSAYSGLQGFNRGFYNTLLSGVRLAKRAAASIADSAERNPINKLIWGESNPITDILRDIVNNDPAETILSGTAGYSDAEQKAAQEVSQRFVQSVDNTALRHGTKVLNSTVENGVRMIPTIILSILSPAAGAGSELANTSPALISAVKRIVSNPGFWSSYIETSGGTYADAKEDGANENQAMTAAVYIGALNSLIEYAGGVETRLGQKLAKKATAKEAIKGFFGDLAQTGIEEGWEEGVQDFIENLGKKIIYKHDAPWISNTDDSAVINGVRTAENMAMGAASGILMGGTNRLAGAVGSDISKTAQAYRRSGMKEAIEKAGYKVEFTDEPGIAGMVDKNTKTVYVGGNHINAWRDIAKHELTHILEDTGKYGEFVSMMKRDMPSAWRAAQERVKGLYERANAARAARGEKPFTLDAQTLEAETAAELGEVLKTERFIRNFAVGDNMPFAMKTIEFARTAANRMRNKVSGANGWDTAAGLWAQALEDVKAERQGRGKRYYTHVDNDGNRITVITDNQGLFEGLNAQEASKAAEQLLNERYKNKVIPLSDYGLIHVNKTGINKYLHSTNADNNTHLNKLKATGEFENLLLNAEYATSTNDKKNHPFAKYGFDHYKTTFAIDGQVFEGIIDVGVSEKGAEFYGMTHIKRVTGIRDGSPFDPLSSYKPAFSGNSINDNISQKNNTVNSNIRESNENDTYRRKIAEPEETDTEEYAVHTGEWSEYFDDKARSSWEEGKRQASMYDYEEGIAGERAKFEAEQSRRTDKDNIYEWEILKREVTIDNLIAEKQQELRNQKDMTNVLARRLREDIRALETERNYLVKRVGQLSKENTKMYKRLSATMRYFRETEAVYVDAINIRGYAQDIKEKYHTKLSSRDIAITLQDVYRRMAASMKDTAEKDSTALEAFETLRGLAERILDGTDNRERRMYDHYIDLRNRLRNDGISLSEQDKADMGDWNEFIKSNLGRIKITDDGTRVDAYYQQLCEEYPELFDASVMHPADRLREIERVRGLLDEKTVDFEYSGEDVDAVAGEMFAQYFSDENASEQQQKVGEILKKQYYKKYAKAEKAKTEYIRWLEGMLKNGGKKIADSANRRIKQEVETPAAPIEEESAEVLKYAGSMRAPGAKYITRIVDGVKVPMVKFALNTGATIKNDQKHRAFLEKEKVREGMHKQHTPLSYKWHDVWRSFRIYFGDRDYRTAKELYLDRLEDAKRNYSAMIQFFDNRLGKEIVERLGIRKGSALSAAVQFYGEYIVPLGKDENGRYRGEYIDLSDMGSAAVRAQADYNALDAAGKEKVVEADRIFREIYNAAIENINDARRAIYPYAEDKLKEKTEEFQKLQEELDIIDAAFESEDFSKVDGWSKVQEGEIKLASVQGMLLRARSVFEEQLAESKLRLEVLNEELAEEKNAARRARIGYHIANEESTIERTSKLLELKEDELKGRIRRIRESLDNVTGSFAQQIERRRERISDRLGEIAGEIGADEITYGREVKKRADYYHHMREFADGREEFANFIKTATAAGSSNTQAAIAWLNSKLSSSDFSDTAEGIDYRLIGKSQGTKPKASFQGAFLQRKGAKTAFDAVGGFLDYIPQAAHAATIDPAASMFRQLADDLSKPHPLPKNASDAVSITQKLAKDFADGKLDANRITAAIKTMRDLKDYISRMEINTESARNAAVTAERMTKDLGKNKVTRENLEDAQAAFKAFEKDLIKAMKNNNYAATGNFIQYLNEFTNSLLGKTDAVDREVITNNFGRTGMRIIRKATGRIKNNMVAFRTTSALAQIMNVPGGMGYIGDKGSLTGAVGDTFSSMFGRNDRVKKLYEQSQFLTERFEANRDMWLKYDHGVRATGKKFAGFMLQGLDEVGTKYIWNAAYRWGGKKGARGMDAIRFADDVTRRCVAGRGIGEMSLVQKNMLVGMLAPFTYEADNQWQLMADIIRDASYETDSKTGVRRATAFAGYSVPRFLLMYLASYLFGKIKELISGTDSGLLNPLGITIEGVRDGKSAGRIAQEIAGNAISSTSFGSSLVGLYPEYGYPEIGLPARSQLFGSHTGSRYGTRGVISAAVKNPMLMLPISGASQIQQTAAAARDLMRGYSSTQSGKRTYDVARTPSNIAKGLIFGRSGFAEREEYRKGANIRTKDVEGFTQSKISKTIETTDGLHKQSERLWGEKLQEYEQARFDEYERLYRQVKSNDIKLKNPYGKDEDTERKKANTQLDKLLTELEGQGAISRIQGNDIYNRYSRGEEVSVGGVEFLTQIKVDREKDVSELTDAQRDAYWDKIDLLLDKGKITQETHDIEEQKLRDKKGMVTVSEYLTGEFSTLSDEEQKKVFKKLNSIATSAVEVRRKKKKSPSPAVWNVKGE